MPISDAFKTFFKTPSSAPYVKKILTYITTGHKAASTDGGPHATPEIICVTKPGELVLHVPEKRKMVLTDFWDTCYPRRTNRNPRPALSLRGTRYVVLCPEFFTITPAPTKPKCPTVNWWGDKFSDHDKGVSLVRYQIFVLLHEAAHFYIFATSQSHYDRYELNNCLSLDSKYSKMNPRSYDYYVTCTFVSLVDRIVHC